MVIEIYLVADNDDSNICSGFLVKLLNPLLALFEAVSAGDVEHDTCANSVFVVHLGEGSVPLLAGCIPHLVLHNVVSEVLVLGQEASSNGGLMRVGKLSICIPIIF